MTRGRTLRSGEDGPPKETFHRHHRQFLFDIVSSHVRVWLSTCRSNAFLGWGYSLVVGTQYFLNISAFHGMRDRAAVETVVGNRVCDIVCGLCDTDATQIFPCVDTIELPSDPRDRRDLVILTMMKAVSSSHRG